MTSLNPCFTVGYQIMEALKVHQGGSKSTRKQRAIDLLTMVGILTRNRGLMFIHTSYQVG